MPSPAQACLYVAYRSKHPGEFLRTLDACNVRVRIRKRTARGSSIAPKVWGRHQTKHSPGAERVGVEKPSRVFSDPPPEHTIDLEGLAVVEYRLCHIVSRAELVAEAPARVVKEDPATPAQSLRAEKVNHVERVVGVDKGGGVHLYLWWVGTHAREDAKPAEKIISTRDLAR